MTKFQLYRRWALLILLSTGCRCEFRAKTMGRVVDAGESLTFYAGREGLDAPGCGLTRATACKTLEYTLARVPPRTTGTATILGDLTPEELRRAAVENGFEPSEGCLGVHCGNVYVNARIGGCRVDGSGSKVLVLCPDGGTTLPEGAEGAWRRSELLGR